MFKATKMQMCVRRLLMPAVPQAEQALLMNNVIPNMVSHHTPIQHDEEEKLPQSKQRSIAKSKVIYQLTTKTRVQKRRLLINSTGHVSDKCTGHVSDKCRCRSSRPSTSPDGGVTEAKMLLGHQNSGKQPASCWDPSPVTNQSRLQLLDGIIALCPVIANYGLQGELSRQVAMV